MPPGAARAVPATITATNIATNKLERTFFILLPPVKVEFEYIDNIITKHVQKVNSYLINVW
jgi:hypothetical protein